jgi:chromosome segregation ATPase
LQLQHALRTANLELNLACSKHSVEVVAKDEDVRKLRFQLQLLDDENDELTNKLIEEEARSDGLETALDEALAQLDQLQADKEGLQNEMRTKSRELNNLKVRVVFFLPRCSTDTGDRPN